MAGWSQRESTALAVDLGKQGATVIDRKNGWTVRFPDGKTTMSIHRTPSDHRTAANYRAEVLRAGFRWPFEGEGFRRGGRDTVVEEIRDEVKAAADRGAVIFDGDTMRPNTVTELRVVDDDGNVSAVVTNPRDANGVPWYPAHVTVDPRPAAKNIAAVRGGVVALGLQDGIADDLGLTRFLRERNHMLTVESTRRVLYWLGWRYDPETVRRSTRGYTGTWVLSPDLDREKVENETLPMLEIAPPKPRKRRHEKPESTGGETVENPPTVSDEVDIEGILALRGGPVDLDVEVVTELTDEGKVDVVDAEALQVAEELLREAEALSERRRVALERMHRERDAARAEVERLQAELARERSKPEEIREGSWTVPASEFVQAPYSDTARIPVEMFAKAGITVRIAFSR
jgi:hypothetical protein